MLSLDEPLDLKVSSSRDRTHRTSICAPLRFARTRIPRPTRSSDTDIMDSPTSLKPDLSVCPSSPPSPQHSSSSCGPLSPPRARDSESVSYLEGEASSPPRPPGFQFFLPIGAGGSLLPPTSILASQRRDRRDSPEPAEEQLACRWLRSVLPPLFNNAPGRRRRVGGVEAHLVSMRCLSHRIHHRRRARSVSLSGRISGPCRNTNTKMMTPLIQGKFKICFIFLLLVTFIGLVTVNFVNSNFKPSKLFLNNVAQKLSFIYLPLNPQKVSNETMKTEPQVSNTTHALVSMVNMLNHNEKEKTEVPTNQDPTSTVAQPDHEAYPRNYQFIIDEPDICKQRKPFLVLMVPVAPQQLEARNAIRSTWGNESVVQGKNVIVLFMLGLNGEEDEAKQLERLIPENRQHHDLIQSNFLDTYKNLTTKTMVILDWLATRCPQASYAMKIDSDMFLNVENLMSLLLMENTPKENYITGMVMWNRPVVRNKFSKWYVPEEVYPENVYPTYLLGMGYVFSNDLPEKLVKVSKHIRPFYIEDAYVGACLKKLGFAPSNPPDPSKFKAYFNGAYDRNEFARVITTILGSPQQLINFWQDLKRPT